MRLLSQLFGWFREARFFTHVHIDRLEVHHHHVDARPLLTNGLRPPGASVTLNRPPLRVYLGGLDRRSIAPANHRHEWESTIQELNKKRNGR